MPIGKARLKLPGFFAAHGYSCGLAVLLILFASRSLQNAVAEGDTRTISMHHMHTGEDITITYKRDGRYDDAALEKLNWFLRDWRKSQETKMDPHLIDLVWEAQRAVGAKEPIQVVCGYRSPETNAMLRRRSNGVAQFSQHMLGKAMDYYIPGVPLDALRAAGLRLERGGVGYYPTSGSPFVHMDTGGIRMWPRMTRQELVRVFPDERTVYIPSDGRPLQGYELALADIRKRGSDAPDVATDMAANDKPTLNPFTKLLRLAKHNDDEDEGADADAAPAPADPAPAKHPVLAALSHDAQVAERATAKVALKVADVASKAKLIRTADAAPLRSTAAAPQGNSAIAATTPNQVILARGYWQGQPDNDAAAQPAAHAALLNALRPRGTEVASLDPTDTGSVRLDPGAPDVAADHAPPGLALAYAEPAAHDTPSSAIAQAAAAATHPAAGKTGELISQNATTIAVKGVIDQPRSSIQKAIQLASAAVKVGVRRDSPWLRAVILSPSVHRFLTTLSLGARDLTSLAELMIKPTSAVMMTFTSDPTLGLTHDRFSGSAIVFLPTVTYPTHTAALQ